MSEDKKNYKRPEKTKEKETEKASEIPKSMSISLDAISDHLKAIEIIMVNDVRKDSLKFNFLNAVNRSNPELPDLIIQK